MTDVASALWVRVRPRSGFESAAAQPVSARLSRTAENRPVRCGCVASHCSTTASARPASRPARTRCARGAAPRVAFREDEHVLHQRGQVLLTERAAVGHRLQVRPPGALPTISVRQSSERGTLVVPQRLDQLVLVHLRPALDADLRRPLLEVVLRPVLVGRRTSRPSSRSSGGRSWRSAPPSPCSRPVAQGFVLLVVLHGRTVVLASAMPADLPGHRSPARDALAAHRVVRRRAERGDPRPRGVVGLAQQVVVLLPGAGTRPPRGSRRPPTRAGGPCPPAARARRPPRPRTPRPAGRRARASRCPRSPRAPRARSSGSGGSRTRRSPTSRPSRAPRTAPRASPTSTPR